MTQQKLVTALVIGLLIGLGLYLFHALRLSTNRTTFVIAYLKDPAAHQDLVIQAGSKCGVAPFVFPTTGVVGYLWDDSFQVGHRHQGIDIFAGKAPGKTPVVTAYPGYLTRLPGWKSAVIERIPSDPLDPSHQIWLYYTHMADSNGASYISSDFPAGTTERFVEAGTPLGYQGDYSGDPANPVGVHLHFSIVKDDGTGHFKNELDINNTYDPSPYLGLDLNSNQNPDSIPTCTPGG